MTSKTFISVVSVCIALTLGVAACGGGEGGGAGSSGSSSGAEDLQRLQGTIRIDGSSTVFPFAQAAAEEFQGQAPGVRIAVGQAGTGGGFEKFCAGETDISNASRPIKDDEEVPACRRNGVEFRELQVANDGIAIVTNRQLPIDCMTTGHLKRLWATDEVENYRDLGASFPDQPVSLFGPGTDSGTFDFFTDEINGEEGLTRRDYQPSEDDNVLVQGVEGDEGSLGYFGFSYYEQNQDRLNLVGVDGGRGCVKPSLETIQNGEYEPLSRPIFMYSSAKALRRPEVKAFMNFVLENQDQIAQAAQMVPMTAAQAAASQEDLEQLQQRGGSGTGASTTESEAAK